MGQREEERGRKLLDMGEGGKDGKINCSRRSSVLFETFSLSSMSTLARF